MALADSNRAIGAVTRLLVDHLIRRTALSVTASHPRAAGAANTNPKINLFLYESSLDPHLKNFSLIDGEPPPLWLVLKYVLTAYDTTGASDTAEAHELIGRGLAALHEVNYLRLDSAVAPPVLRALENNPETLKLTFDETTHDLLSKLMQGPDETYRFSVAFHVRPVMIVPAVPPSYSQLVGVNYETTPHTFPGEEGIRIEVLPSLGPRITGVSPESFSATTVPEERAVLTITGEDLHISDLHCMLGPVELGIIAQRPDELKVRVGTELAAGTLISAGEHPLVIRQRLANGRYRSSNFLSGKLRPTVDTATLAVVVTPGTPDTVTGTITLAGNLLGRDVDDVRVAFQQNGQTVRLLDIQQNAAGDQTSLGVTLPSTNRLPAGMYRLIVVVNGQQATTSPAVDLTVSNP